MASSVHPFQGYQGNGANNQPPPGYGNPAPAYGGHTAGYGGGASTGAPGSVGYPPYGAPPPNAGYAYGVPQLNAGYAYGGAPPGTPGYTMGTPGIGYSMDALGNIDAPMSVPGNQAYGYGAPNPAGYIGDGAPAAYLVGGAPPGYPAHAPPPGTVGYPYGAAPPSAAYPVAIYPVGGAGTPGDYMGFKGGQPPSQQPVDPRNQIQTGRWAAGLCACCDNCVPNLCMPWCCPCISLAQIYARMGMQGYKLAVARFFLLYVIGLVGTFVRYTKTTSSSSFTSGGVYYSNRQHYTTNSTNDSTTTSSTATLILTVMAIAGQTIFYAHIWHVRSKVRKRFHIPGGACGDCCTSCCCSCCAIAQLATHVKSYTPGSCDFGGPDVLPAYTH